MASMMLSQTANVAVRPFSPAKRTSRRQPSTVTRASKDEQASQAPSDFMMKAVGTLAAAQLAFLPAAGPALAAQGKLAVEGGLDAGESVQQAVPKGAKNPKVREERNTSRDAGIDSKLSKIKQRVNPDNILNSPDIESGGRQNIFAPKTWGQKGVSFEAAGAAPSLQVNVGLNQAGEAASKVADAAKDAAPGGGGGLLGGLGDKIKSAAVTSDSPSVQLQQGADKAKGAVQDLKRQPNVSFTPAAQGSLLHFVSDLDNASFQKPQSNEGGITQPTQRTDLDLPGNPKRGGDLKDAPTDFAAQNKGERDEGTPGQTGATPRAGANTPTGTGEIRNPSTPTLPNALGGKNFLRDDSETPEETAAGNIAKAQQSSGNAVDSLKKGLGL